MQNELTLIQINDAHAYLDLHPEVYLRAGQREYRMAGGYGRIAALVRSIRSEGRGQVLFLDNGDTLHGTRPAVQTQGAALVPVLNEAGLDGMTVHWDAVYGPEVLKRRAAELNYPVLAANLELEGQEERPFEAYRVVEKGNMRIAIIGLASNLINPPFSTGYRTGLGLDRLPGLIQTVRSEEKADLVVVLSHLGFPQDLQLAKQVDGIDVLLSGHTHNRVYQPVQQGETLIIQSGSHGSFLGRLDLSLEGGRICDYRHRLMEVTQEIEPDPEMQDRVQAVLAPFHEELSEVVGEATSPLDRLGMLETSLDNLLLLALKESTGTELAFSNGWRYGAPILAGQVTLNNLYNLIPMDPPVSTVELTGEEVMEMLEENLERTFSRDPFNQMGGYLKRALGLKAYIKVENPKGQRLQQLFVGEQEVQPGQVYTTSFVTQQGVPEKYGRNRQDTGLRSIQALRAYLGRHSSVRAQSIGTYEMV